MSGSAPFSPPLAGLLLAAGRGRRMGTTKQLLPWPPRAEPGPARSTVIESAFDAIAPHCRRMIVVLGHESDAVRQALGRRSCEIVMSDPDSEMIESIRLGLRQVLTDSEESGVLLHPGDHPQAKASTIRMLIRAHRDAPEIAIMPQHAGRGGHPVLIPLVLVGDILSASGAGGLRAYWDRHPERCRRLAVDDPHSVFDLDTPDSLESFLD